ncbi:MAG: RES family NAD+ phosphorylase, partial [Burkholderiales bacterium]
APPDGLAFGTLYLGQDAYAAFIEAFSQGVGSTPLGLFISASLLRRSCLCAVQVTRPLRLVDLTSGAALKRLSASADSRVGDGPHVVSQSWAAALWTHPDQPDGLIYRARNAPDHRSIALFDRAADALVADCATNLLLDAAQLGRILDHFGCTLIP